jgi:peroxiredoxin
MRYTTAGKRILTAFLVFFGYAGILTAGSPEGGSPAPDFTLTDIRGKIHTLSDYKGKVIVLEWTNPNCPFVVRHYSGGDMQSLQKRCEENGVVWLAINSTHSAHRDFMTSEQLHEKYNAWKPAFYANLIDADGKIGRLYGAKTTPHMFVIDKDFTIVYQGAIDSDSRGKSENRVNYVDEAVAALTAGKAPAVATTPPYGCSVKYGN